MKPEKVYPYQYGDEYYTVKRRKDGRADLVWSIWDLSLIHISEPTRPY